MCAPNEPEPLSSQEHESQEEDYDYDSDAESERTPRYTPDELAAIFLDFYTFLTTLHYAPEDLKLPPPGGWPNIPDSYAEFKSPEVVEVLRRLPYLSGVSQIHFQSWVVDYSAIEPSFFASADKRFDNIGELWSNEDIADPAHFIYLAEGRGNCSHHLLLNVFDSEIIDDVQALHMDSPQWVEEFFEHLKEQYRDLKMIPCPGRLTIDASKVEEREGEISEEEFRAQTGPWESDLDIQYVRQIYRQHGWPEAFRREEATKAIDELMDSIEGQREYFWLDDDCV